ncbi:MAG: Zn-ribbon domain-containing OB-fold protein [Halobacteriales archaeon]|nr:Zn-ribbon domain-containing OB-fold protein [Halobacteriales archaeon]
MTQGPRFWRSIDQRYNLEGVKCGNCGQAIFPARTLCPTCRHLSVGKLAPFQMSGAGTVESFTVVHSPPNGFELQAPYVMAIVKLAEGPKLTAQIVDVDNADMRVGMPVHKVFRRINQDGEGGVIHYGYKFSARPVRGQGAKGQAPMPVEGPRGSHRSPGAPGRLG